MEFSPRTCYQKFMYFSLYIFNKIFNCDLILQDRAMRGESPNTSEAGGCHIPRGKPFLHYKNASNVVCSRHFCSLTILFNVHHTLLHILWPASLPLFSAFGTSNNNQNLGHCPILLLTCTLASSFPQQSLYYSFR